MERRGDGSNAGGFDFEFVKRNAMLAAKGVKPPTATKTGTTIAGVIYKVGGFITTLISAVEFPNTAHSQAPGICTCTPVAGICSAHLLQ
jgi:20S proteasome subunit beta 2